MKFGLGILYKNLAKKNEFRENKLSGNQILHKNVPEFLHIPPVFPENLVNSVQKLHTIFSATIGYVKFDLMKAILSLRVQKCFVCNLFIFIRFCQKLIWK